MQLLDELGSLPLSGCRHTTEQTRICMQDIETAFRQAAAEFGFDFINYSYVQPNIEGDSTSEVTISYTPIFNTYPEAWMQEYIQKKFYEADAVARTTEYMSLNSNLHFGSWAQAKTLALEAPKATSICSQAAYGDMIHKVYERASVHGLCSGVYIIHRNGPVLIVISLGSAMSEVELKQQLDHTTLWNKLIAMTILVNHAVASTRGCVRCSNTAQVFGTRDIVLTHAQKKILRCYAEKSNATLKEIAQSQGTSTDTVKFHLKSIRAKFNKPRLAGSALARFAIDHNLI